MAPILGYWKVRALAQPIRYLLHFVGVEFDDKFYHFGPAPDYNRNEWLEEKFTLGFDFPNLPYYIDGDVKITQSLAILRYLAKKHGLSANTERDIIKQDILEQQSRDIWISFAFLCIGDFERNKDEYIRNLPDKLKPFSSYLGDKQWLMGDKLTYVDFILYEALDYHRLLVKDCFDSFPNLNEYLKRFESLPSISSYMKSDKYVKWPILGPIAKFGWK